MGENSRRLLALSVYHCVNDGSLAIFASALPVMRVDLGLGFLEIGTILSTGLIGTMLLQLLFGSLSDYGHATRLLVLGFAGIVVADLAVPISSGFVQLLVFYVFLRSAAAVYHPVSLSSIGRTYARDRTGAFGFQGAVGDLGLAFATLSTGILSEIWGWRVPFWAWGGFGFVLFVYFVATLVRHEVGFYSESNRSTNEANDNSEKPRSLKSAFVLLALVSSVTTVSFVLFTGYMPLYFNVVEGLSPAWSTTLVAAWIAMGVFTGFMAGRVVGKLGGEVRTLRVAFVAEAALLLVANLLLYQWLRLPARSLVLDLTIVLTGVPAFIAFPASYGLLGLRMPHGRLGLTYASNLSLGLLVASLATYLNGYLASITSIAVTLPLLLAVAIAGAVASLIL